MKKTLKHSWFLTLSDLMTLILCFFVMLFSMSTPKQNTYTAKNIALTTMKQTTFVPLLQGGGVDLKYLEQILKNQNVLPNSIQLYHNRLILNIDNENNDKISNLIQILNNIDNQIEMHVSSLSNIEDTTLKGLRIVNDLKNKGLQYQIPLVVDKASLEKAQIVIFQSKRGFNNAY